jgi:tight adherence protein B
VVALQFFLALAAVVLLAWWLRGVYSRRLLLRTLRDIEHDTRGRDARETMLADLFRFTDAGWIESLSARFPRLRSTQELLQQSGLKWSPERYLAYRIITAVAVASFTLLLTRGWVTTLVALFVGSLQPVFYLRRKRAARLRAFEEQLPGALELLARAVRAGHPMAAGLKMVADDSSEPLASEFRRVFEEQRFGLPLEDSLVGMSSRVAIPDARLMVTALLVQRDVGGNLAEILGRIAHMTRERFTINRQIRVFTAQGRMSGNVLSALPIGIALVLLLINPDYILTLVRTPIGRLLLGIAVTMQLIGHFWIRRIVDLDV